MGRVPFQADRSQRRTGRRQLTLMVSQNWTRRRPYAGWPLPFDALHNQRSLIALGKLVDLLLLCSGHLAARGETFLAADGKDVSTAELCRGIGVAVDRPARLFPVPTWVLEFVAKLAGRQAAAQSLCGSLQVDASKVRGRLDWSPRWGSTKACDWHWR
jgi:nucleoside-diphosphate-sugar epimerase